MPCTESEPRNLETIVNTFVIEFVKTLASHFDSKCVNAVLKINNQNKIFIKTISLHCETVILGEESQFSICPFDVNEYLEPLRYIIVQLIGWFAGGWLGRRRAMHWRGFFWLEVLFGVVCSFFPIVSLLYVFCHHSLEHPWFSFCYMRGIFNY